MRTRLRCRFASQNVTSILYYAKFGRMRRFLINYLLRKRTNNVRNILSLFTLARQKVDTQYDYLSVPL
jgi:hypothetical protein